MTKVTVDVTVLEGLDAARRAGFRLMFDERRRREAVEAELAALPASYEEEAYALPDWLSGTSSALGGDNAEEWASWIGMELRSGLRHLLTALATQRGELDDRLVGANTDALLGYLHEKVGRAWKELGSALEEIERFHPEWASDRGH